MYVVFIYSCRHGPIRLQLQLQLHISTVSLQLPAVRAGDWWAAAGGEERRGEAEVSNIL